MVCVHEAKILSILRWNGCDHPLCLPAPEYLSLHIEAFQFFQDSSLFWRNHSLSLPELQNGCLASCFSTMTTLNIYWSLSWFLLSHFSFSLYVSLWWCQTSSGCYVGSSDRSVGMITCIRVCIILRDSVLLSCIMHLSRRRKEPVCFDLLHSMFYKKLFTGLHLHSSNLTCENRPEDQILNDVVYYFIIYRFKPSSKLLKPCIQGKSTEQKETT